MFLSLDGIDGTGKSTQCALLAEWLRQKGREVVTCIDPGGTPLGQELRTLILSGKHELAPACEALLFMASRAQLVASVIRPALDAGKVVLSDRFLLATVVYQGHAGRIEPAMLWEVDKLSTGGLLPGLTILLDLPIEKAKERRGRPADNIERRPDDYHRRVREGFLLEARRSPERVRVVDASGTVEEVQARIRQEVERWAGSA
jgi:dTMP kinase